MAKDKFQDNRAGNTVVISSKNKGKLAEFQYIFSKWNMKVITRDEAGVSADFDVEEDGETFEENSLKKAEAIMEICQLPTMADDSGLKIQALNGAPGVFSARFSGEEGNDRKNIEKVLDLMKDVPKEARGAYFETVITLLFPSGEKLVAKGKCQGRINEEPLGDTGFGYDPIFIPDGYEETFAQLGKEIKNQISHRAMALKELERLLKER